MAIESKLSPKLFYGLSTDSKPIQDVPIASVFIETDTGDEFLWLDTWTQHKGALSSYMTMTTLIAGENAANFSGGFIQTSATGPDYYEPNLTISGYDAYGDANQLILGFDYFGSGGTIYVTTYNDQVRAVTMRDSAVYGIQSKSIQCKKIWGTTESPATTACDGTRGEISIYMTKVIKG